MMEYGDVSIKEAADVLEALDAGATAIDLLDGYGDRIAGLIAAALDMIAQKPGIGAVSAHEMHCISLTCSGQGSAADREVALAAMSRVAPRLDA